MTGTGAAFGAVAGLGMFLIWQGAVGGLTRPAAAWQTRLDTLTTNNHWNRRALTVIVCGIGAFAATGWPIAAILGTAAGWWFPTILTSYRTRTGRIERTEAIAAWTEQIRDVVAASGGITEALAATARVAPAPIRPEISEFARRLRRDDPDTALSILADTLNDPTADQVIVALRLALSERGDRITEILSAVAAAAREEAVMVRNIEASRAKLWRQAVTVTTVVAVVFGVLLAFQRDYLAAYDTFGGQVTLAAVGILWAVSLHMMVRLANVATRPRILNAGIDRYGPATSPTPPPTPTGADWGPLP